MNITDFEEFENQIKEKGRIQQLDNGLVLILENSPGYDLIKGDIILTTGSGYDPKDKKGLIHFLEHATFGPSENYKSSEDRSIKAVQRGLVLNATTNHHVINYPIESKTCHGYLLKNEFLNNFDILLDMIFKSKFDSKSIETERNIILRETKEREDKAASNIWEEFYEEYQNRLYSQNPWKSSKSLETCEDIQKIGLEDLKEAYSRLFVGENTIVKLIGDLDEEILQEVTRKLSSLPKGQRVPQLQTPKEIPFQGEERIRFKAPYENEDMANVNILYQIQEESLLEGCSVGMIKNILDLPEFKLYKDLREQGLIYQLDTNVRGHNSTSYFNLNFDVEKNRTEESIQKTFEILKELREGKFNEDILESLKRNSLLEALYQIKQPGLIAKELSDRHYKERFNERLTTFDYFFQYQKLTKKDLMNTADKYFNGNRLIAITD
jgi:predicted Zn-dependent peptidase